MKLSIEDVFLIAKKGNLPCFEEVRCILIGGRVRVSGMALGPNTIGDGDGLALYVKQTREPAHPFLMPLHLPFPHSLPVFTLPSIISRNNRLQESSLFYFYFPGTIRISSYNYIKEPD